MSFLFAVVSFDDIFCLISLQFCLAEKAENNVHEVFTSYFFLEGSFPKWKNTYMYELLL